MKETPEEYRARLEAYVTGRDPLEVQTATSAALARLVDGVPDAKLRKPPGPGRWSVVEILAHMAEDELVTSWRYRQMLERNGAALAGFDQDLWARLGDYASWAARDALEMFRLLREANLRVLRALSPEQWERTGHHEERGPMSVRDLARHMAGHDENHVRQISALVGRR
jgi:DinB superfamily